MCQFNNCTEHGEPTTYTPNGRVYYLCAEHQYLATHSVAA